MPTITLQVGQCGNQLGGVLFERLAAQAAADPAGEGEHFTRRLPGGPGGGSSSDGGGSLRARALCIDTEPKVVAALRGAGGGGLYDGRQCFVGQSGRGNNWAFGYSALSRPSSKPASTPAAPAWDWSTATEDPSQTEYGILAAVLDGIRREAEECDACPSFLLLHSLAGGSGSGLGSRLLECVRQEYPTAPIAAASVAPRTAGDTPMQSLNAVMALSFLQAYADCCVVLRNGELVAAAGKAGGGGGSGGLESVNRVAAERLAGWLWPLDGADAAGGVGRIRDTICTVAADPCTKLLEAATVALHPATPVASLWPDSLKALAAAMGPRGAAEEGCEGGGPVTTAGALLTARGYPAAAASLAAAPALLPAFPRCLGPGGAVAALQPGASLFLRCGAAGLAPHPPQRGAAPAAAAAGTGTGGVKPAVGAPSLTALASRSSTVALLEGAVGRAMALCDAGAYLHWYERHGCPADAVREAAGGLLDVADCYRQLHGMRGGGG